MKNRRNSNGSSIDGFIPRRPNSRLGELNTAKDIEHKVKPIDRTLHTGENISSNRVGEPRYGKEMNARADIDESLLSIDSDTEDNVKRSRRQIRKDNKLSKKPKSKTRRIIKWFLIAVLVAAVAIGGWVAYKAIVAGGNMFKGSLFDLVQNQPLKKDSNGRSNFLIFGTAEDSEGGEHGGANLTDSIMIVSVDQEKKDAYMLSLPRDLWVEYVMPAGSVCSVGYQGKLNAQYFCASDDGENEEAGAKALQEKVGQITGLDVQYYVHLNFTAVTEAVDAVGGVDVVIQSDDPRGILDRNFDWRCGYKCYMVNYKNGEQVHLDGEHALALARARNAAGGYGLPNGNFDREKNQQMIIKALLKKAVSAGTLTNLGAVTGLIDALGNNLRTNIETKEIRTLMDIGTKVPMESIVSLTLNDPDSPLVTTGMQGTQSIVRPVAGLMNYSEIKAYVQRELTSDPFVKEDPQVTVLNGTGMAGIAQVEADTLSDLGFTVGLVDNAPEGKYQPIEIYQIGSSKAASVAKLKSLYGVDVKTTTPPASVTGETDFLIIIGDSTARISTKN